MNEIPYKCRLKVIQYNKNNLKIELKEFLKLISKLQIRIKMLFTLAAGFNNIYQYTL